MNNTPSLKLEISLKLIISILIALTLTAVVTYFATTRLSNPVERDLMSEFKATPSATSASANQDSATDLESVDVLLVGLKQRLEAQPDDVDGWVLLSKSYYHLDRWKEADEAFEKAKALGYRGSWQPLPRIDSFSQNSASTINFKDYKINQDSAQTVPQAAGGLQLKIRLNPALQKELSPAAAVFVFVRAAENPGPPLAVVRTRVGELPFEITLNDSHAMMPGKNISSARNVIVGARISISGNPERQPGDYEQLSNSIPSNTKKTVELTITDKI
jgi:cytochrome c-type biogenesis protein CcmH